MRFTTGTGMGLARTILFLVMRTVVAGMLIGAPIFAQQTTLYVFYPSTIRPQTLQKQLSDELPGVSVTVFGRYIDFAEQVKASAPDVILTKPDVIRQFGSYALKISGTRNGSTDEPYILVSEKKDTQAGAVTIGAVDFLGRHGMDSLGRTMVSTPARINRVSKIEDLLPLLTFGMADAVLVSVRNADYLARTSNMQLFRREISGEKVGIVALGVKKDSTSEKAVRLIKGLSKETCLLFDIEEWRQQ
jgi:hypothetical protein